MNRQVLFKKVTEVPEQNGFTIVSKSVSDCGVGLFLYVENEVANDVAETYESDIGVFPKARMFNQRRFKLVTHNENTNTSWDLPLLDVTFPFVDLFPDGRVLVTDSRSEWRKQDDFDLNATVIDPTTSSKQSFLVGDGIEASAVDSNGRIWVSYFDEGIFGSDGWGHPGPEPIGASGLNCFGDNGALLWAFPHESEMGQISDCYAMNVSGDRVAIYADTEFALCRISQDFEMEYWTTDLQGCRHFAISDSRVLFTGQYEDAATVGYFGTLSEGGVRDIEAVEFALPDNNVMKAGQLLGRGDALHYFDDTGWYCAQIGSLV